MVKRNSTSLLLAILMLLSFIIPSPIEATSNKEWFDDAVSFAIEKNLMFEESGDFKPNDEVSEADALLAIYHMIGKPEVKFQTSFTNIAGEKYEDCIKWAESIELIKSSEDGLFKFDQKISREKIAQLLEKASELKGFTATKNDNLIKKAQDYNKIQAEYLDSMTTCYNLGLIKGRVNSKLHPDNKMLRKELAQALKNFSDLSNINGKAISVNKYGNTITDISVENFHNAGFEPGDIVTVKVDDKFVNMPYGDTYSNVDNKKEIIVPNKDTKNIVVAINMGNFAKTYGIEEDTEISFRIAEKAGYLEEYKIRNIDKLRTNNRDDYSSDIVFANFRPIVMGNIQEGILYRSSSPANPMIGRAGYSDKLAKKAGISTVINLADSKEELEKYFSEEDFESIYYKNLYDQGQVVYLNLGVDFSADEFNKNLKKGFEFMIEKEGPFLIHCNEGKDRAGFVSALLEALMGANVEEIKEDYMLSYINYYHVEKDSEQYEKIANSNIMTSLKMITGVDNVEDLSKINLQKATENYLTQKIGLTPEQVKSIQKILSENIEVKKAA